MPMRAKIVSDSELALARYTLSRAQDAFYRTITACSVSDGANDTGPRCREFALIYSDAIEHYIECLKYEPVTEEVILRLQNARELKRILRNDLDYLSKFSLPQFDETPSNGHGAARDLQRFSPSEAIGR